MQPTSRATIRFRIAAVLIVLLLIGLMLPIVSGPMIGTSTIVAQFNVVGNIGLFIALGLIACAALLAYYGLYRYLAVIGAIFALVIMHFELTFTETVARASSSVEGNIFGGIAKLAIDAYHIEWGATFILIVAIGLVAVAFMKEPEPSPTVSEFISINRAELIAGAGVLFLWLLIIGLYPTTFAHASVPAARETQAGLSDLGFDASGATPAPTEDPKLVQMRNAISVGVLQKGFHEADPSNFDYQSGFTALLQYHNVGKRTVKAFKGVIEFRDQFGERITGFKVQYEEPLAPGQEREETGQWNFNQFMGEDVKLRDTPLSRLKVTWQPQSVIFSDGATLSAN